MGPRIVAVTGLSALSVLHAIWATGSPWPATSSRQLAEAVVGQAVELPRAAPTAVVAAGTAAASVLASGLLGTGRVQTTGMRAIGSVLLVRAAVGGGPALAVLGLPPAGETFRSLDRRFYRPLAAVLGVSLWLVAATTPQPRRGRRGSTTSGLRAALVDGERSGDAEEFDVDAFIAAKKL